MAINSALFTPRTACWALTLLAAWQFTGTQGAAADDAVTAPEKIVVVDPAVTKAAPRLLYALDGNQMSIAELRPGTMETKQLSTYLSMLQVPVDLQAAMADPTTVMMAMIGRPQQDAAAGDAPGNVDAADAADFNGGIQTAAAVEYTSEIMPRSYKDADGSWVFPRQPDVDEREVLSLDKWRVEENPESQALFLGPDRRFGWDDFADLINPLQHLPLVSIAYREITGDKIYGAARLLDVGFGPVAGVSTVVDLAVTDMTGSSMSDHAVAALFGSDNEPAATDNLAHVPEIAPAASTPVSSPASAPQTASVIAPLYNPLSYSYYPEASQLAARAIQAQPAAVPVITPEMIPAPNAVPTLVPDADPSRGSNQ